MRAINTIKPVNVLVRTIVEWIATRRDEIAPFDSFEALRPEKTEQKDVERWIFNCNYVYYRLGDALLAHDALPESPRELAALFAFLDANVKTIRDTNPLNLRSKSPEAMRKELAKDWPPFQRGSRNKLNRVASALHAFAQAQAPHATARATTHELLDTFHDEAELYRHISQETEESADPLTARMRKLLPLWCFAGINPLYTLRIWEDGAALDALASELCDAWRAEGYPEMGGTESKPSYQGLIRRCCEAYCASLAAGDAGTLAEQPLPQVHQTLERAFFSLDHPYPATAVPAWLAPKCLLIWNLVVCAVLGPGAAIRTSESNRTATTCSPAAAPIRSRALAGAVTLRRRGTDGLVEPVASLTMAQETQNRVWLILGSSFDENARVPAELASMPLAEVSSCFVATNRYDARGTLAEGRGDSRYHALLRVEMRSGRPAVVLSDLGSKNGTSVVRVVDGAMRYMVLRHRSTETAEAWAQRAGINPAAVTCCDEVELERGDVLQLCGSCFDLV